MEKVRLLHFIIIIKVFMVKSYRIALGISDDDDESGCKLAAVATTVK